MTSNNEVALHRAIFGGHVEILMATVRDAWKRVPLHYSKWMLGKASQHVKHFRSLWVIWVQSKI